MYLNGNTGIIKKQQENHLVSFRAVFRRHFSKTVPKQLCLYNENGHKRFCHYSLMPFLCNLTTLGMTLITKHCNNSQYFAWQTVSFCCVFFCMTLLMTLPTLLMTLTTLLIDINNTVNGINDKEQHYPQSSWNLTSNHVTSCQTIL